MKARTHSAAPDARLALLSEWIEGALPVAVTELAPASADASFRRYFRATLREEFPLPDGSRHARTVIAMDAPPPHEDCRPYIKVAALLNAAGVHAPAVLAADVARGFLLLTDLGQQTYSAALDERNATPLYRAAWQALTLWQLATRDDVLPPYNEVLLRRELDLFPEWYVARHLGVQLTLAQKAVLETAFRLILDNNLRQPQVYVHRDYHSRNLMVIEPNPGVLDFQDAVLGPITYDLVSLLRDAYITWDEELQLDWAARYWEHARQAGLPVAADFGDFWRDYEWMGVQRQLKVLGIFARLCHRDGKSGYLADMPRVMQYLRSACARYRELGPLLRLLDELEQRQPAVGYTF
jgi:aminoglycoside/choline kinase family phosphotransferase